MIDLNTKFGRKVKRRLKNEQEIWLTTVDSDGIPQPRPVWFWWDGESFLIYSEPQAYKIEHLAGNPQVALNFNSGQVAADVVVFIGTAVLDPSAPPSYQHKQYLKKYLKGIQDLDMTPEEFSAKWSLPLRVHPPENARLVRFPKTIPLDRKVDVVKF